VREAAFRDLILGDVILSFDGHVVELFGSTPVAQRIHRLMLSMQISGPTAKATTSWTCHAQSAVGASS
jgi:hypothetical protein